MIINTTYSKRTAKKNPSMIQSHYQKTIKAIEERVGFLERNIGDGTNIVLTLPESTLQGESIPLPDEHSIHAYTADIEITLSDIHLKVGLSKRLHGIEALKDILNDNKSNIAELRNLSNKLYDIQIEYRRFKRKYL